MDSRSVVLSWGPPRMGTTWMYNILRAMLEASSTLFATVTGDIERPALEWDGPVLVKSHHADPATLIERFGDSVDLLACVMVRDTQRTFASLVRTQKASRDEVIGWLESDLASYQAALPHMRHVAVVREEWVAPQAAQIVERLNAFLGLGLDADACTSIAHQFDREQVKRTIESMRETKAWSGDFTEYDQQTQWHADHIAPDGAPTAEPTLEERARLDRLQAEIDDLIERHSLWNATNAGVGPAPTQSAMAYIQARDDLAEAPAAAGGMLARLRALLGGS